MTVLLLRSLENGFDAVYARIDDVPEPNAGVDNARKHRHKSCQNQSFKIHRVAISIC